MTPITLGMLFILFSLVSNVVIVQTYADSENALVSIPAGTSIPGCEADNMCFIPSVVSIDKGGKVTWTNNDYSVHTVTSGTPTDGPDGMFDSSIINSGSTFSFSEFTKGGQYDYFCIVHPWMQGTVVVGSSYDNQRNSGYLVIDVQSSVKFNEQISYKITLVDGNSHSAIIHIIATNGNIAYIAQHDFSNNVIRGTINTDTSSFKMDGHYTFRVTAGHYTGSAKIKITDSQSASNELKRVSISNVKITDTRGTLLSSVKTNQQIMVNANIQNNQNIDQPYTYLIQIKNSDDTAIHLSWISSTLSPNYAASPSHSWLPADSGTYTITVYAWNSITNPIALSPSSTITVNVLDK